MMNASQINGNGPPTARRQALVCITDECGSDLESLDSLALQTEREFSIALIRIASTDTAGHSIDVGNILATLARRMDLVPAADDAVIIVMGASHDLANPSETYRQRQFALRMLDAHGLRAAQAAFSSLPDFGLATLAGTPQIALATRTDTALQERLAHQLSIPVEQVRRGQYFPAPMFYLRAACLRGLIAHLKLDAQTDDPALLSALSLGFQPTCLAIGYDVRDLLPGVRAASAELLRNHVAQRCRTAGTTLRSEEFKPPAERTVPLENAPVKYIAYYLPQFHAIPENDRWWGTGFTEWTNVSRAAPRFVGHYQPRLPADLGFYDLSRDEVMTAQIKLARRHGIHGFCFYFYWFNGKTLLETPLKQFLADPAKDFPFCLCWANENWTRRWDGQEQEILIEQSHSARDDIRFIEHISQYLRDPRYIRIDGKPLLLVYRASLLGDARATVRRWRDWCCRNGIGEIHLAAVLSFDIDDPRPFGFDSAVEFPPHQLSNLPPINNKVEMLDRSFSGEILDYRETVLLEALGKYPPQGKSPFPRFHGVMTGWDNDARRNGTGRTFHHATPSAYANWLRLASTATLRDKPPQQRYVFINAWNEWAEGAHLEPCRHFGHAYLRATSDTLGLLTTHHGILRHGTPGALGSSSALLHHLPAHLFPRREAPELALYRQRFASLGQASRIRVVLTYATLSIDVFDTLQSLAEQSYTNCALSVVSPDHFAAEWASPLAAEHMPTDDVQSGINTIANRETDDWLLFVSTGDRILPHGLLAIASAAAAQPDAMILYADECNGDGELHPVRVTLRAGFDPVRHLLQDYLGGVLAVRRNAFVAIGGLQPLHDSSPLHDLVLRICAKHGEHAIRHVPEILAWRRAPDLPTPHLRPRPQTDAAHERQPLVSIIVPTHEQPLAFQRCVEALFAHAGATPFELIIIDHMNQTPPARTFLDGLAGLAPERIRVLAWNATFNIAAMNNMAATQARGTHFLFLNDDIVATHTGWLEALLSAFALRDDVGIAGCRLDFPSGKLQHAGVVLGLSGAADFIWSGREPEVVDQFPELAVPRTVSAVTGSCMMVERSLFERLAGFDEHLSLAYADFDLCLRAREDGSRTVFTPEARLTHDAGSTLKTVFQGARAQDAQRAFEAQQLRFITRWRNQIAHDPFYHPAHSLTSRQGDIEPVAAFAPDPIDWHPLPNILALPADHHGSGQYRVIQPSTSAHAAALIRGRCADGYPLPIMLERLGIDTLFTQRQVDDAQLLALTRLRATMPSLRIVVDFDDALMHVPAQSIHNQTVWPDIERRLVEVSRLADALTVSTEPLAMEMRRIHPDVRIVQNAIDPKVWTHSRPSSRIDPKRLRVGWAGGVGHAADLAILREVVKALADEVDWVFFGMCLEDMRPHLTEFHRGIPFEHYPAKLADLDLDLALAPLAINRFNECKSNLRLLEYGALGIPVIATSVTPYKCGLPVTLVDNRPQSWIRAIRDRIREPEALTIEGEKLRSAILSHWTIERMLPLWIDAWTCKQVHF